MSLHQNASVYQSKEKDAAACNFSLNTEQNQNDMIENLDMMSDDHTILVMSSRRGDRSSMDSSGNQSIRFIEEPSSDSNTRTTSNMNINPDDVQSQISANNMNNPISQKPYKQNAGGGNAASKKLNFNKRNMSIK